MREEARRRREGFRRKMNHTGHSYGRIKRLTFLRRGGKVSRWWTVSAARTCCTRKIRVGTFTSSSASLEELRACQCSCHRRRTFVSFPLVSISRGKKSLLACCSFLRIRAGASLYQNMEGLSKWHTWNEHNKLSSTLIIAPALSNSPQ